MDKQKITLTMIREDLKEIRYYYTRKETFDKAHKEMPTMPISILAKVNKYNEIAATASARLYDLYLSLYTRNFTQEGLADEIDKGRTFVQRANEKLVLFLYEKLNE
jgi:acyl-CoA reductase-like NAD-dependent aldehyde dehydrogenase